MQASARLYPIYILNVWTPRHKSKLVSSSFSFLLYKFHIYILYKLNTHCL